MTVNSMPSGFRFDSASLLVNEGPTDTAAGIFGTLDAPALWSRQVLTDGQLRAVAITLPDTGPEPFQAVHAVAERTAEDLGVGAVEVAVCWLESTETRLVSRLTAAGWAVAGYGTTTDFVLLVTDAVVSATELRKALADVWRDSDTVLLLASGASGQVPGTAEFAATLAALRVDLACPKGGAA